MEISDDNSCMSSMLHARSVRATAPRRIETFKRRSVFNGREQRQM